MVLAMILATYLKIRAFGPISAWDIAIPVMFLGLGQWEALLGATGASPEACPLLLIVAYCFAWIEGRGVIKECCGSRHSLLADFHWLRHLHRRNQAVVVRA